MRDTVGPGWHAGSPIRPFEQVNNLTREITESG